MLNSHYIVRVLYISLSIYAAFLAAGLLMQVRRYSVRKTALLWGLAGIAAVLDLYFCFGLLPKRLQLPVSMLIGFLFYMGVFLYVSADGFWKKLYLMFTYCCVCCISWSAGLYLCYFLFPDSTETVKYLVRTIAHIVIAFPILLAYRKFGRPLIREVSGFHKRSWMALSGVSVIFCCIFAALMSRIKMDDGIKTDTLFFFFAAVCTFAAVNALCISNIFYMRKEARTELVKQNVEYMAAYVENARKAEEQARRIRHDKRHHDELIASLAKSGDTEGILKYLQQENTVSQETPRVYCPNTTVNSILVSYAAKAEEAGVAFAVEADTGSGSLIEDVDFVAILANLLENALHACVKDENNGPVDVRLRMVGKKTVIVVSNPCGSGLKIENGLPVDRGIGIDSIVFSAARHQGEINYTVEDGICTACVILNP